VKPSLAINVEHKHENVTHVGFVVCVAALHRKMQFFSRVQNGARVTETRVAGERLCVDVQLHIKNVANHNAFLPHEAFEMTSARKNSKFVVRRWADR